MWIPSRPYLPFCIVTRLRDARAMQVLDEARERGYELEERPLAGRCGRGDAVTTRGGRAS
jgi:hypothetical protein